MPDPKLLGSALKAVKHAVGEEGTKFGCVWIVPERNAMYRVVATDNFRAAVAERGDDIGLKAPIAVRGTELNVLMYWLARAGTFKVASGAEEAGRVTFWDSATALVLEDIKQPVPDWRSVVEQFGKGENRTSVLVDPSYIAEAAAAARISDPETPSIYFEAGGPSQALAVLSNGYREWIMPKREDKPDA